MNNVSRDIEKAELDANFGHVPGRSDYETPIPSRAQSRASSISSSSASSNSSSSPSSHGAASEINPNFETMSRATTYDLERHPTAMSRIATYRSQHSETVGASFRSRVPKRPLPNFGAGKPYPQQLPDKEEYVVEFDGPDDPLHPQNWSMKKK